MSDLEVVGSAALFVLGGFLLFKYRQSVLRRAEREDPRIWTGKALDATDLKAAIKQVRSDYIAARPKPKSLCFHRSLLGFARRTVARLPYFHDQEKET